MTYLRFTALISLGLLNVAAGDPPPSARLQSGQWRAWLDSPGGKLPFGLELQTDGRRWSGRLVNGPERIEIPSVSYDDGTLVLDIDHYDSRITATVGVGPTGEPGSKLDGEWTKRGPDRTWSRLGFHALLTSRVVEQAEPQRHIPAIKSAINGRWAVDFSSSTEPAVGIFGARPDGEVWGTFLTTLGDYRFLAGEFDNGKLRLSCFDGAHAFLFTAVLQSDNTLAGDFWSRDTWHETWTARRDPDAVLPDAFSLTKWNAGADLSRVAFPDLAGTVRSLADPMFAGRARLIVVFGSWCPNCGDATEYLVELHTRYASRGLSIVGLAFEYSGNLERDTRQVQLYADRHGIEYPILIAGLSDKAKASEALPILDRVRAYPTTIFLDASGDVRAIHTGFSGPATGEAHLALRAKYESIIESMLPRSGP